MKPILIFTITTTLALAFSSCGKQKTAQQEATAPTPEESRYVRKTIVAPEIDRQARWFASAEVNGEFDLLNDSIDIFSLYSDDYIGGEWGFDLICAPKDAQYIRYQGNREILRNYADYYNAMVILENLQSDLQTVRRYGFAYEEFYGLAADSILMLDCSIIRNPTLRHLIRDLRDATARTALNDTEEEYSKRKSLSENILNYIAKRISPVQQKTKDAYFACMDRTDYFEQFDSVKAMRGLSDKAYQQELLTNIYLAKTPAERHIYAIEFAHSDSMNVAFTPGALVLLREFVDTKQYSPYLVELWRTWRAFMGYWSGDSTWSYLPNWLYNQKRKQVAEIIFRHIEEHPDDLLAQGVLIELADINNVSRYGGMFGNGTILERIELFPESEKDEENEL